VFSYRISILPESELDEAARFTDVNVPNLSKLFQGVPQHQIRRNQW
jgi:hypothetical protein